MSGTVLLLGASSPVARSCAEAFARRGIDLILAGRDAEELEHLAGDLHLRFGVEAGACVFDAAGAAPLDLDPEALDGVLCAVGAMGEDEFIGIFAIGQGKIFGENAGVQK